MPSYDLKANVNALEATGNKFSGDDHRLDYAIKQTLPMRRLSY
jgi:hypothetical protein